MKTAVTTLMIIAIVFLSLAAIVLGTDTFHTAKTFGETAGVAMLLGLIGTVALSGFAVVLAVDEAKRDNAARLEALLTAVKGK